MQGELVERGKGGVGGYTRPEGIRERVHAAGFKLHPGVKALSDPLDLLSQGTISASVRSSPARCSQCAHLNRVALRQKQVPLLQATLVNRIDEPPEFLRTGIIGGIIEATFTRISYSQSPWER
jgi:hypothetical protein